MLTISVSTLVVGTVLGIIFILIMVILMLMAGLVQARNHHQMVTSNAEGRHAVENMVFKG